MRVFLGRSAAADEGGGYDAIAVLEEEQHLRVPIIGRQRPAVPARRSFP
jgi:hypothetical protein